MTKKLRNTLMLYSLALLAKPASYLVEVFLIAQELKLLDEVVPAVKIYSVPDEVILDVGALRVLLLVDEDSPFYEKSLEEAMVHAGLCLSRGADGQGRDVLLVDGVDARDLHAAAAAAEAFGLLTPLLTDGTVALAVELDQSIVLGLGSEQANLRQAHEARGLVRSHVADRGNNVGEVDVE